MTLKTIKTLLVSSAVVLTFQTAHSAGFLVGSIATIIKTGKNVNMRVVQLNPQMIGSGVTKKMYSAGTLKTLAGKARKGKVLMSRIDNGNIVDVDVVVLTPIATRYYKSLKSGAIRTADNPNITHSYSALRTVESRMSAQLQQGQLAQAVEYGGLRTMGDDYAKWIDDATSSPNHGVAIERARTGGNGVDNIAIMQIDGIFYHALNYRMVFSKTRMTPEKIAEVFDTMADAIL